MTPTVHPVPPLLTEKAANQAARTNEPEPASFGDLLRQQRLQAGLTQQLLAELAGLSVHGVQKLERGATRPYPDTARRLLKALQLAPAELAQFQSAARPRPRRRARLATAPAASSSHLPTQTNPFVGRHTELAHIAQLFGKPVSRLVTLVGPGGIGKTRLAIEAARQHSAAFPDGVCFVALAPVESPRLLASTIAEALSISLSGSQKASTQLVRAMRDKRLLLVLDNFEHLLEGTSLLTDLLDSPNVKLLVTSRERLNLQEEWVEEVGGLVYPRDHLTRTPETYAAVELFVQRAQQVQTGFSLAANTQAVVDICQRVEGMPLGLELAATWLRVMPCQEIAPQIERNLDFLTTTVRNVPERHRSVRAVLDHSWNLLSETERQVLARLSIFRSGFDLEAAHQVAGAALPVLASLVDKSLIRFSTSGPRSAELHGAGRYELHELLRQYLAERLELADPSEIVALTRRHLEFFSEMADTAEAHLFGPDQETWFDRLEIEHDNLRAALAWSLRDGRVAAGMRMAGALGFFWELRSHWYEGDESLARLVERAIEAPPVVRAKALRFGCVFALHAKDDPRARALCDESLRVARESGDPSSIAVGTLHPGHVRRIAYQRRSSRSAARRSPEVVPRNRGRLGHQPRASPTWHHPDARGSLCASQAARRRGAGGSPRGRGQERSGLGRLRLRERGLASNRGPRAGSAAVRGGAVPVARNPGLEPLHVGAVHARRCGTGAGKLCAGAGLLRASADADAGPAGQHVSQLA